MIDGHVQSFVCGFGQSSCARRTGRGLVEEEDGGVLDDGARDGQALLLAARQVERPRRDVRVVAVGPLGDEIVGVRGLAGGNDLLAGGVGLAERDVGRHAALEEHGLLLYDFGCVVCKKERSINTTTVIDRSNTPNARLTNKTNQLTPT